jgi:hypothetical protein
LAHKPGREASAEYYYVVPELEKYVKDDLKNVMVLLVADMNAAAESFLWVVPVSDQSPYYNAVALILKQGKAALEKYVYQVKTADIKSRTKMAPVSHRLRNPNDPIPVLPSRPIGVLLAEALGSDRIIRTPDHPVFVALTSGSKLS